MPGAPLLTGEDRALMGEGALLTGGIASPDRGVRHS